MKFLLLSIQMRSANETKIEVKKEIPQKKSASEF